MKYESQKYIKKSSRDTDTCSNIFKFIVIQNITTDNIFLVLSSQEDSEGVIHHSQ